MLITIAVRYNRLGERIMSKKPKPSSHKKKTSTVNVAGGAHVQAKGDLIGGDKNVGRDEYNVQGDLTRIEHLTLGDTRLPLDFEDLKQKYLAYVVSEWRKIRLIGFSHGRTDVDDPLLEDVFVSLHAEQAPSPTLEMLASNFQLTTGVEQSSDAYSDESFARRMEIGPVRNKDILATERKVNLSEVLTSARRLVILGAPGAGKSTLLQFIALIFARSQGNEKFGIEQEVLPFRIILREFAKERGRRDAGYSLEEFLFDYYHARGQNFPPEFFRYFINKGECILLLDGMDELASVALRAEMRDLVEGLARAQSSNRIVVSSRTKGYAAVALDRREWTTFSLLDFDDDEIKQFITKWYRLVEGKDEPEAKAATEKLTEALEGNENIKGLAENPLLLAIIVTIHYVERLPNQRVKLYDKCVESLLIRRDEIRGLSDTDVGEEEHRRRLEHIGYWMQTEQLPEVSRDELQFKLARFLKEHHSNSHDEARRFIDHLVERTGILVERSPDRFGFVHRTFQEYFAAMDIYFRYRDEDDRQIVQDAVLQHVHDSRWEEVLQLTIAKLTPTPAMRVIETILQAQSWGEDVLHRDLMFAANCLANSPELSEVFQRQVFAQLIRVYKESQRVYNHSLGERIETIFRKIYKSAVSESTKTWLRSSSGYDVTWLDSDDALLSAVFDQKIRVLWNMGIGSNKISSILIKALKNPDRDVRRRAASWLEDLGPSSDSVSALVDALHDSKWDVAEKAAEVLGSFKYLNIEAARELTDIALVADAPVCDAAAKALKHLENNIPEVCSILVTALKSGNYPLQERAALVAGLFGHATSDLVATLITIMRSERLWIRQQIERHSKSLDHLNAEGKAQYATDFLDLWEKLKKQEDELGVPLLEPNVAIKHVEAKLQSAWLMVDGRDYRYWSPNHPLHLLKQWREKYRSLRRIAAEALAKLDTAKVEAQAALIATLDDGDDIQRSESAEALIQLGSSAPELGDSLADMLRDKHFSRRWHSVEALGKLKSPTPEAISALIETLSREAMTVDDLRYQRDAAVAMGQLGHATPEVVTALLAALKNPEKELQDDALASLGRLSGIQPAILQDLSKALVDFPESERSDMEWTIWQRFISTDTPAVRSTLLAMLNNTEASIDIRCTAAVNLARLKETTTETIESLVSALGDTHPELRESAAHALNSSTYDRWNNALPGEVRQLEPLTPSAIATILKASHDENLQVRREVVRLLARLERYLPEILPILLAAIRDSDKEVRSNAMWVLAHLGTLHSKAVMAMLEGTRGEDEEVVRDALWGLWTIAFEGRNWAEFSHEEKMEMASGLRTALLDPRLEGASEWLWAALWMTVSRFNITN